MNYILEKTLNFFRRKYLEFFKPSYVLNGKSRLVGNVEYGNKLIKEALLSEKPVMIARLGTTETGTLLNYIGVKKGRKSVWKYITNKQEAWWWNWSSRKGMSIYSGFFPTSNENLIKFSEMMLNELQYADILISLSSSEEHLKDYFKISKRVTLPSMEPYFSINPWTHALEGKKVLVVHPMVESFKRQWANR